MNPLSRLPSPLDVTFVLLVGSLLVVPLLVVACVAACVHAFALIARRFVRCGRVDLISKS